MRTSRRSASSESSDIAQYIYSRGTANGKRVQAFGGAKNHGIVMPDADLDQVVNDLAGAAFGSAGERCMALPVVVPVGEKTANDLREKLIPAIRALRVGISTDPEAHYGPVVNAAHKKRIEDYIQMCIDEGGDWSSTGAASRCRATRRAGSSARPFSTM
jgi:malonate-semialdehyde dehydrogenase (acetylating) / methylmalonate-semialdehyde dehydrogenase